MEKKFSQKLRSKYDFLIYNEKITTKNLFPGSDSSSSGESESKRVKVSLVSLGWLLLAEWLRAAEQKQVKKKKWQWQKT
jgi:hypothetical protein